MFYGAMKLSVGSSLKLVFRRWVEDFQQTPYEHTADEYVYRWGDHR